jgi:hypothetical protein
MTYEQNINRKKIFKMLFLVVVANDFFLDLNNQTETNKQTNEE